VHHAVNASAEKAEEWMRGVEEATNDIFKRTIDEPVASSTPTGVRVSRRYGFESSSRLAIRSVLTLFDSS